MKTIWNQPPVLEDMNARSAQSMVAHLGIEFIEAGADYLRARLPVDDRTLQPDGILHGGASVALAETLGSVASNWVVDRCQKACVGLEINANHIRSVRSGYVVGTARPLHLGKSTHVWEIRIENEQEQLVCIARLTMAVLDLS